MSEAKNNMKAEQISFKIKGLDHVALRVTDMENSIKWYGNVLGLKKVQLQEWGSIPVFMLAGKTGVALFPADMKDEELNLSSKHIKLDHFAFEVDNENFDLAKKKFNEIGLEFKFEDHYYFHSIYMQDPDEHIVELTTLVVPETDVYGEI